MQCPLSRYAGIHPLADLKHVLSVIMYVLQSVSPVCVVCVCEWFKNGGDQYWLLGKDGPLNAAVRVYTITSSQRSQGGDTTRSDGRRTTERHAPAPAPVLHHRK